MDDKRKRISFIIKIIDVILCFVTLGLVVTYYLSTNGEGFKFLSMQVVSGVVLMILGLIGISLSVLSRLSPRGDNKGDDLMLIVGFCMIILGFISFFISI